MDARKANDIDEYISAFPPDVQALLQRVRATIAAAAPGATEAIKYQIPTFVLNGNLVHFAAYENHIGFYPAPHGMEAFREELAPHAAGKGSARFPLDQAIPFDLITRIVKFRVEEQAKAPAKKKKKA